MIHSIEPETDLSCDNGQKNMLSKLSNPNENNKILWNIKEEISEENENLWKLQTQLNTMIRSWFTWKQLTLFVCTVGLHQSLSF